MGTMRHSNVLHFVSGSVPEGALSDFHSQNTIFIRRPRISAVLDRCIEKPLTTLIAGPGYGKTHAVSDFLAQHDYHSIRLTLTMLDNEKQSFWHKIKKAFAEVIPPSAKVPKDLSFPETLTQFNLVKNAVLPALEGLGFLIIVIDNFELLTNEEILTFFQQCFCLNYEKSVQLRFILISNKKLFNTQNPLYGIFQSIGQYNHLTEQTLAFDVEEIRTLFATVEHDVTQEEATQLLDRTQGWPIFLSLLRSDTDESTCLEMLCEIFDNQYYFNYPEPLRRLLIQLSLLPSFTINIVKALYPKGIAQAAREISANAFIFYDYAKNSYAFQIVYKRYLSNRATLLSYKEKTESYIAAGNYYYNAGAAREALDLFIKARNYKMIIRCLSALDAHTGEITYTPKLMEVLRSIPDAYTRKDPWVSYHLANCYLATGEIAIAKVQFAELAKRLEADENQTQLGLLGEVFRNLADISLMQNDMTGLESVKKSLKYAPKGSENLPDENRMRLIQPVFFLPEDAKISVGQITEYIDTFTPFMVQVYRGFGYGYDSLFEAEADLMTGDLARARLTALGTAYKARAAHQHDIVMDAYYLELRIAVVSGDYEECIRVLDESRGYFREHQLDRFNPYQDVLDAYFYLSTDKPRAVASWISAGDLSVCKTPIVHNGRFLLISALYMIHEKDFAGAFALLSTLDGTLLQSRQWTLKVYSLLLKSIIYFRIGEIPRAQELLQSFYRMTNGYEITFPLLEFGIYLMPLIQDARQSPEGWDAEWLKNAEHMIREQQKTRTVLIEAATKDKSAESFSIQLTKRERQILGYLSQGLTREEIAEETDISINGVKKHLSNIYKKLGAGNRAEAIYIAVENQLL